MKKLIWYVVCMCLVVTLLQIYAVLSGHYDSGVVFIDIIQHILAGIALGMLWIWILWKKSWSGSLPLLTISIVLFSIFGSFVWEIFEFFASAYLSEASEVLKRWSFHRGDELWDMTSGLIGGTIVAVIYYCKNKS